MRKGDRDSPSLLIYPSHQVTHRSLMDTRWSARWLRISDSKDTDSGMYRLPQLQAVRTLLGAELFSVSPKLVAPVSRRQDMPAIQTCELKTETDKCPPPNRVLQVDQWSKKNRSFVGFVTLEMKVLRDRPRRRMIRDLPGIETKGATKW